MKPEEGRPVKKQISSYRVKVVKEQAHILRWLEGRPGIKNGAIYSTILTKHGDEYIFDQIRLTPELFIGAERALKKLKKYYILTPKILGQHYIEEKAKRLEEIKKFLNLSIIKNGWSNCEFRDFLVSSSMLSPPPEELFNYVRESGLPRISPQNLPDRARRLYFYLSGCMGIKKNNTVEGYCGQKYPFVKDPLLLIEIYKIIPEDDLKKVIEIMEQEDDFIYQILLESVERSIPPERIRFITKRYKIFQKYKELAFLCLYLNNFELMEKLFRLTKNSIRLTGIFLSRFPLMDLIKKVGEEKVINFLSLFSKDELTTLYNLTEEDMGYYPFEKTIFFTHPEEAKNIVKNHDNLKIFIFAFTRVDDFLHFFNFWKDKNPEILKVFNIPTLSKLYKDNAYEEINKIFRGINDFFNDLCGSRRLYPLHYQMIIGFKNWKGIKLNPVSTKKIQSAKLIILEALYYLDEMRNEINEPYLVEFFANIEPLIEKLSGFSGKININEDALALTYYLTYGENSQYPETLLKLATIGYKNIPVFKASEMNILLQQDLSTFRRLMSEAFLVSPIRVLDVLHDLKTLACHLDIKQAIGQFLDSFNPSTSFHIREKQDFERELGYLLNVKNKNNEVEKRIKNIQNIIKNYDEYRNRMEAKELKKQNLKVSYRFLDAINTFISNLLLSIFDSEMNNKYKNLRMNNVLKKAIAFSLNLEKNKRAARSAIKHIIIGDYKRWIVGKKKNREFLEKLKGMGINVKPLIEGFSKKFNDFTVYMETKPINILQMGELFSTCLSLSLRWNRHNYALVPYLVDINKKVIFIKNKSGEIIARTRLDISDKGFIKMMKIYKNRPVKNVELYFKYFIEEFKKITGLKEGDGGNFHSVNNLHESELEYIQVLPKPASLKKLGWEEMLKIMYSQLEYNPDNFLKQGLPGIIQYLHSNGLSCENIKLLFSIFLLSKFLDLSDLHSITPKLQSIMADFTNAGFTNDLFKEAMNNHFFYYLKIDYTNIGKLVKEGFPSSNSLNMNNRFPTKKEWVKFWSDFPHNFTDFLMKNMSKEDLRRMEKEYGKIKEQFDTLEYTINSYYDRNLCKKGEKNAKTIAKRIFIQMIQGLKKGNIEKKQFHENLEKLSMIIKVQFHREDFNIIRHLKNSFHKLVKRENLPNYLSDFVLISIDKTLSS